MNNSKVSQVLESLPNNAAVCVVAGELSTFTNKATACKVWSNETVTATYKNNNIVYVEI